jgi:hypothetical protein
MANLNEIDVTFCKRIIYEEWRTFKKKQDIAIDIALKVDTGTLHAGGAGRRYSLTQDHTEIIASLLHPDYERYQDMRHLRHGRTNSRLYTPKIVQSRGKRIHNAVIWGRLNVIAFRCINDLKAEVIKNIRGKFADRNVVINF